MSLVPFSDMFFPIPVYATTPIDRAWELGVDAFTTAGLRGWEYGNAMFGQGLSLTGTVLNRTVGDTVTWASMVGDGVPGNATAFALGAPYRWADDTARHTSSVGRLLSRVRDNFRSDASRLGDQARRVPGGVMLAPTGMAPLTTMWNAPSVVAPSVVVPVMPVTRMR